MRHPSPSYRIGARGFSAGDWSFDGTRWSWAGTGYDPNYSSTYTGRSLLTPQAPLTFASKLDTWLQQHPSANTTEMQQLVQRVGDGTCCRRRWAGSPTSW